MNNIRALVMSKKLVLGFIIAGIVALLLRGFFYSAESIPSGDSVWQLTMSVSLVANTEHPTIYMAVPMDSANNRVISQSFTHPGLDIKRLTQRKNIAAREIIATAHDTGKLTLTGEYKIHVSSTKRWAKWFSQKSILTPENRMQFLEMPDDLKIDDEPLRRPLRSLSINARDQDALLENIFNFVNKRIVNDNRVAYESVEKSLLRMRADSLGKANVMVALCRASNIPARIVTGVVIQEMLDVTQHHWVEIYTNDRWLPYDPSTGHAGEIPPTYLKLREDSAHLAYQKDGLPLDVDIDIEQIPAPAGLMGTGEKHFRNIFDLARLPMTTQLLLSSLLMLPFGALITTFFRHIVGVQTYGTFKSSLLALAIIYADWLTVAVVVSLVTIIGIGGRSILPEKMTRVPRLSIVLTIVAIAMVLSVSLMDYYNLNPSASVVLLPIIVMTSLVDRVYAIADEKGVVIALHRLLWTCLIAGACYLVFTIEMLRQLVIRSPEIHFFTLALVLLCNDYKWKKLTELKAFHWMREPKSTLNKKSVSLKPSNQ